MPHRIYLFHLAMGSSDGSCASLLDDRYLVTHRGCVCSLGSLVVTTSGFPVHGYGSAYVFEYYLCTCDMMTPIVGESCVCSVFVPNVRTTPNQWWIRF